MSKVRTCLWFNGNAEQAARFYVSLLADSRIDSVWRSPMAWPGGEAGGVIVVEFTLAGAPYMGLNGGPNYALSPAASISVLCDDQAEVDRLWDGLLEGGGAPMQCGWLTDRYGVSWQITPRALSEMMKDPDPAKVRRVMEAFMPMVKLEIAPIEAAYRGG